MMILHGDCIDKLKTFPTNYFDSVVTDPPYGLAFMGKKWDYDVPSVEIWQEVLRVLKPGGHLLSFGGTRTYHRMVVNIEDAGFEIRDQIQWLYGTGYPKHRSQLKPAHEPIVLSKKRSNRSTLLNIDQCRVPTEKAWRLSGQKVVAGLGGGFLKGKKAIPRKAHPDGLYPSNVIIDERAADDLGDKSRIFYIAKPSKNEKGNENFHPTVKPLKLMEYLIKLVTPPKGIVLDPFAGSGTTLVAAKKLGFEYVGIEREIDYCEISEKRLEAV